MSQIPTSQPTVSETEINAPAMSDEFLAIAQRMIPARSAGSLFTVDEHRSLWGLGADSPLTPSDHYDPDTTGFLSRINSRYTGLRQMKIEGKPSPAGTPHLVVIASAFGGGMLSHARERYNLGDDPYRTANWATGYYGDPENFYVGMVSPMSGDLAYVPTQDSVKGREIMMFYARALNAALMSDAVENGLDIVYRPADMDDVMEDVIARVRDRGYKQHTVIIDAPLENKIDYMRAHWDDYRHRFASQEAMVEEVREQHSGFADYVREQARHSDRIEIQTWDDDPAQLQTVAQFVDGRLEILDQEGFNRFMITHDGLTSADFEPSFGLETATADADSVGQRHDDI